MNWFESVFLGWLADPDMVGELSDWHTRWLFLTGILVAGYLLVRRQIRGIDLAVAFAAGFVLDVVEAPDYLAAGLKHMNFLPERIAMFSGEIVMILLGFALGAGQVLASTSRRWRTRDRLTAGGGLLVVATLLWAYHGLLINGWLLAGLQAEQHRAQQLIIASGPLDDQGFVDLCRTLEYECLHGDVSEHIPHANAHIEHVLNQWLDHIRPQVPVEKRSNWGDSLSDGLATPETPFALAYAELNGRYRLAIEHAHARRQFDAARISFFTLANMATLFWMIMVPLVIVLHRRRKPRKPVPKADG